jgi:hypothetical protein
MPKTKTKRTLTSSPGSQKRVKRAMSYKDGVYSSGVTARPYVKKIGKALESVKDKYADLRDKVIMKDKRERAIYKEARDKDRDRKYESYDDYKKRMKKFRAEKAQKKAEGGMMNKNLKPVDKEKNPGLAKLPTDVRNKMGYMKDGGMVLEIGLRPATKSEMKMAKEMKKPVKKANGGMVRGTGAAITGKGFKGVF